MTTSRNTIVFVVFVMVLESCSYLIGRIQGETCAQRNGCWIKDDPEKR